MDLHNEVAEEVANVGVQRRRDPQNGRIDAWRPLLRKARHAKVCACLADGAFRFWFCNHNHFLTTRERMILVDAVQVMPVSNGQHWGMY